MSSIYEYFPRLVVINTKELQDFKFLSDLKSTIQTSLFPIISKTNNSPLYYDVIKKDHLLFITYYCTVIENKTFLLNVSKYQFEENFFKKIETIKSDIWLYSQETFFNYIKGKLTENSFIFFELTNYEIKAIIFDTISKESFRMSCPFTYLSQSFYFDKTEILKEDIKNIIIMDQLQDRLIKFGGINKKIYNIYKFSLNKKNKLFKKKIEVNIC